MNFSARCVFVVIYIRIYFVTYFMLYIYLHYNLWVCLGGAQTA